MSHLSIALRRSVAAIAVAMFVLDLSACNSSGNSFAPGGALGGVRGANGPILSQGYNWYTVDDHLGSRNQVTGINDSLQIVGNYTNSGSSCTATSGEKGTSCADCPLVAGGTGQNNKTWYSYTSSYTTGYTSFTPLQYPRAKSQYLNGISNQGTGTGIEVGCLIDLGNAGGGLDETWGAAVNNGLWSAFRTPSSGTGCNANQIGEAFGIGTVASTNIGYQVGFKNNLITANNCPFVPWIVEIGDDLSWGVDVTFSTSGVTPVSVEATGIDSGANFVVGSATVSTKTTSAGLRGWYGTLADVTPKTTGQAANYETTAWSYKNTGDPTSFTGVRVAGTEPKIVGWYTAGTGTHGFVLTITASGHTWSDPLDAPGSDEYTVISGTDSNGDICGWYKDSGGTIHGFAAMLAAIGEHRKHHHGTAGPRT
ncbi:MAG TPA: hypothetical protein VKR56_09945 [Candidatus Cybelea sp.]|nr:hypothetical protein [Candidatus Cybelea sp.]